MVCDGQLQDKLKEPSRLEEELQGDVGRDENRILSGPLRDRGKKVERGFLTNRRLGT